MKGHPTHLISAALLWVVLTAVGWYLALADIYPTAASEFAHESDEIFQFLMILGVPVFTFVVAVIFYSVMQFRVERPDVDGPRIHGTGLVPVVWLAITGGLAVFVMVYPGLVGVADLRRIGDDYGFGSAIEDDAVPIHITAFKWAWTVEYLDEEITLQSMQDDLVLPVDRQVLFIIDSVDVVHSFWIPAFRMKMDALPGRTTRLSIVATETGSHETDAAFRVQCAELCGLQHSTMAMPIRVVEQDEFERWLGEKRQGASSSATSD